MFWRKKTGRASDILRPEHAHLADKYDAIFERLQHMSDFVTGQLALQFAEFRQTREAGEPFTKTLDGFRQLAQEYVDAGFPQLNAGTPGLVDIVVLEAIQRSRMCTRSELNEAFSLLAGRRSSAAN